MEGRGTPLRADRHSRLAAALALLSGLLDGLAWALLCPPLAGLDATPHAVERLACGLAAGGLAALAAPRGVLGSSGAARLTLTLAGTSALGALLAAVLCVRVIGATPALALGLAGLGVGVGLAVVAGMLAFAIDRRQHPIADAVEAPGVRLRPLLAGVCGTLALAGWALASGHVLGERHHDASMEAVAEARDLVAIAAERLLSDSRTTLDGIALKMAPPGGFLVSVDDEGRVKTGVGVGVTPDQVVAITDGPPTRCRAGAHDRPCALRRLPDGTRLLAAVPARAEGGVMWMFLLAGLAMALAALALGGLLGNAVTRDLDVVTLRVDELRRSAKGARAGTPDQPIVVGSLDEIGRLAAALASLRAKLKPTIAEYHRALAEAQTADRARDEFLQLVSIELRSPLDKVIARAKSMLEDPADPLTSEQKDDVNTVLAASRQLTDLIDEVLDVSAIATGQVQLRLARTDIGAIVSEVVKIQRPILMKKGVDVQLTVDEPSPEARADERRVRQVLTNIVSNAVKFTERGSIDVKVRCVGSNIEISVKDTGPGMPAEALPKLFREFVQLGSLKQRAHGTGLGLAICRRLVDAHGGTVRAESELGVGSTFHVTLPVAGPAADSGDDTPLQAVASG
jgi:signal transduction histidine kinase